MQSSCYVGSVAVEIDTSLRKVGWGRTDVLTFKELLLDPIIDFLLCIE